MNPHSFTVTIANGATTSEEFHLGPFTITAIEIPAGMEGTSLTFEVGSSSGSTAPLKDQTNSAVTIVHDTSAAVFAVDANDFLGFSYAKIISSLAQTGDAVIRVYGYTV